MLYGLISIEVENKIVNLASLILDFGKVDRKTAHQDGEYPESDTDHTVMLGILGSSIASKLYKDLDVGLVAQFALVHDLVEVHAGDTPTLIGMTPESFQEKSEREELALQKIKTDFGNEFPWIHETIEKYERLDTKEARFVKVLDKIMPKLTVMLNEAVAMNKNEHVTKEGVKKTFDAQREKIKEIAPDMPEILDLWEFFVEKEMALIKK